jgi:poly(3-hydroxybutyrate) depolymerase
MTDDPTAGPPPRPAVPLGHLPPGIVDAGLGSLFELYDSLVRNTTAYYSSLLSRQAGPLDVAADLVTWSVQVTARRPPVWASQHTVTAAWPLVLLRDFSAPDAPSDAVPLLLLPPQAGHNSCIVDFAPGQSQVQTARAAGLTRVFSLDWVGATQQTKGAGVQDYLDAIQESVARLGGRVHLAGDCQGGWLAVIYAALHPDQIATLTIAGAPVDFHAGEPLIHDWMQTLAPDGMPFYRSLVAAADGVLPGDLLLTGFKIMQPEAETDRQLQLLARADDAEHAERYRLFEDWFQHTQPIPGAFYLWIVEHLFMHNELIAGTLEIGGERVDLAAITCPLNLLAGSKDHITPPAQVYALADRVGTPPAQVTRVLAPGGHLGLFMSQAALRDHWTPLFASLAAIR